MRNMQDLIEGLAYNSPAALKDPCDAATCFRGPSVGHWFSFTHPTVDPFTYLHWAHPFPVSYPSSVWLKLTPHAKMQLILSKLIPRECNYAAKFVTTNPLSMMSDLLAGFSVKQLQNRVVNPGLSLKKENGRRQSDHFAQPQYRRFGIEPATTACSSCPRDAFVASKNGKVSIHSRLCIACNLQLSQGSFTRVCN